MRPDGEALAVEYQKRCNIARLASRTVQRLLDGCNRSDKNSGQDHSIDLRQWPTFFAMVNLVRARRLEFLFSS